MKTNNEIRIAGLRLADEVIRLQYNVNNGCFSDNTELEVKKNRLQGFKKWAEKNNEIIAVKHYFASANFGQPFQFIAQDIAEIFYQD